MRLTRARDGRFSYFLSHDEGHLLLRILSGYPHVPQSYHRLSRDVESRSIREGQVLLDEALAARKAENREQLRAFLTRSDGWRERREGFCLTIEPSKVEWFLEVLNDVRVGSWLALGSPDAPQLQESDITEAEIPFHVAMEFAGWMQHALLSALDSSTGERSRPE